MLLEEAVRRLEEEARDERTDDERLEEERVEERPAAVDEPDEERLLPHARSMMRKAKSRG